MPTIHWHCDVTHLINVLVAGIVSKWIHHLQLGNEMNRGVARSQSQRGYYDLTRSVWYF